MYAVPQEIVENHFGISITNRNNHYCAKDYLFCLNIDNLNFN